MSELFASILLDEDVHILVAKLLRSDGHDVMTVSELQRKGLTDADQLRFASENGFALLTHNRIDFEELAKEYFEKGLTHFGIIISVFRAPYEIAEETRNVLDKFSTDELKNQVIYI